MTIQSKNPWDCLDTYGKKHALYSCQAELVQWPLKLTKVSSVSPYFHKAHLLLAADCTAFSYNNFHGGMLSNRVLVIGCPDLEDTALLNKLRDIILLNDILSIRVLRMDAPCCQNWINSIIELIRKSKKRIPLQITTVFSDGEYVGEE